MTEGKKWLKQIVYSDYLGELSEADSEFLTILGTTIGSKPILLKNIYLAFLKNEQHFEYKPMIGAALQVDFYYAEKQAVIKRAEQAIELSLRQFQKFMGAVDLLFNEVYPIGTVIELDESYLTPEVRSMFLNSEIGMLVSIHGRRVLTAAENEYIDYIGTIWPFGILDDTELLYVNNLMIKRVVSLGMKNEIEEKFVESVLRKQLLDREVQSILYNKNSLIVEPEEVIDNED